MAVIARSVIVDSIVLGVMCKQLCAIRVRLASIKTVKVNRDVWHAIVVNLKMKPGKNIALTVRSIITVHYPRVHRANLALKDVTQPKEGSCAVIARLARKRSTLKMARTNVSRVLLGQLHKPEIINVWTAQSVNINRNLEKAIAFPACQENGTTTPQVPRQTSARSV